MSTGTQRSSAKNSAQQWYPSIAPSFLSAGMVAPMAKRAGMPMEHADVVAVIAILHFFPFDRDAQLLRGHGLKSIGLGQRYPHAGLAFDLRQSDPINKLELIGSFDNARLAGGVHRERTAQKNEGRNQKPHRNSLPRMLSGR